ncbi:hypothetical protein N7G274_005823 [Stereocaulon virgatum]|uniref:GCN5-related N-acetyltransferase Rv2170-like domain-containing protein n=1 Tax=Stereocaulon virgatum TaxID=373712 RepID=A0ABR4A7S1_9LECA
MSLPLPHPQTHTHTDPLKTLAPFLLPDLPHSLPLLRRIQHRLSSPTARTLATFPPPTSITTPPPSSFSALWIDRSRAPETECWLFSTYELPSRPHTPHDEAQAKAQILALFHAVATLPPPEPRRANDDVVILGTLNECLLPLLAASDLEHLVPEKVLSRSVVGDARTRGTDGEGKKGREDVGVLSGLSVPYMKWIIAPPPSPAPATDAGNGNNQVEQDIPLPANYHFDRVRAEKGEYKLVISRSDIPRTEKTLSELGSKGIRYLAPLSSPSPSPSSSFSHSSNTTLPPPKASTATATAKATKDASSSNKDTDTDTDTDPSGDLISWSFLSPDGSLSSLHVEPAHRGLGLAKAVSRRLFRHLAEDPAGMGFRAVEPLAVETGGGEGIDWGGVRAVRDEAWAHSDVAVDNLGSAGVVRRVGGREGWVVRWVGVGVGMVGGVIEGCKVRGL